MFCEKHQSYYLSEQGCIRCLVIAEEKLRKLAAEHMPERTYSQAELDAAVASALTRAAEHFKTHCYDNNKQIRKAILSLIPAPAAAELERRDKRIIQEKEYKDFLCYLNDYERMTRKEFAETHGEDIAEAMERRDVRVRLEEALLWQIDRENWPLWESERIKELRAAAEPAQPKDQI